MLRRGRKEKIRRGWRAKKKKNKRGSVPHESFALSDYIRRDEKKMMLMMMQMLTALLLFSLRHDHHHQESPCVLACVCVDVCE